MLQRMRELSIQAANGTNSAMNLLIRKQLVCQPTPDTTGLILDGTFINKQLQVTRRRRACAFSIDSVAANQIGTLDR